MINPLKWYEKFIWKLMDDLLELLEKISNKIGL